MQASFVGGVNLISPSPDNHNTSSYLTEVAFKNQTSPDNSTLKQYHDMKRKSAVVPTLDLMENVNLDIRQQSPSILKKHKS